LPVWLDFLIVEPKLINTSVGFGAAEDLGAMTSRRPLFDEYWNEKKIKTENIRDIPMYLTASYSTGLHCEGSFHTFETAQTPRKWLRVHDSQEWHDLYRAEAMDDLQKYFDFYAKGINNGWEKDTPRVRLSLLNYENSHAQKVVERHEEQWPPRGQTMVRYYLDSAGRSLVSQNPTESSSTAHESHSLSDSSVSFSLIKKYRESSF
jgi:predicted acyl esterase